jgi:mono/diheme cytochrome c family protein
VSRLSHVLIGAVLVAGAAGWWLTRPQHLDPGLFAGLSPDPARGEAVFHAAGCASCHMAPGAQGDARLVLSGGQRFETPFGTFVVPNISTDPVHGIGGWSVAMLGDAVLAGVSPQGAHYYPAFPWDSYSGMTAQDLTDLHAFMTTLPADATPSAPHEMAFPFTLRRGIGLWKLAFARAGWVVNPPDMTEAETRGRYLVEVLGHCGECHTPRDARTGAPDTARWLAGGPDASGKGRVPNITPGALDWTEGDIATYLETGFTPDYDSAGGHMALVVSNFARLPESDRLAVTAYLKRVAPVN